ncbi:hypothetical protein EDC39_104117 [Geothermobacter ehrlichii]|uniref:Outer membrane lipoprotein-sorting protein n=1 Tax=Geothermobacter ehrlichii TaxID=213224 RepID=A0A5D3WJ86_9BACT|nr:hypothetical protein [Geothermobacter ehrlichii]TYO98993.1 hypothetical protein EDC39_104117 [Geothermobacter ehrlichii]
MRIPGLTGLLSLFLVLSVQAAEVPVLEKVARAYAKRQPALENYVVTVETDRIRQTIEQMTASLPADVPRPPAPVIRKYWKRSSGKSLIRAEGANVFPLMRQMAQRFSRQFALELFDFFLPAGRGGDRARFFDAAEVKVVENDLAGVRLQSVTLQFAEPVDLGGAFYGDGFGLPQKGVRRLVIDVDPEKEVVKRIEITTADDRILTLEARYREVSSGLLPEELMLTSFDGSLDARLETVFKQFDGIWLPVRQTRSIRRGERQDAMTVSFVDYEVNTSFAPEVEKLLAP